VVVAHPLAVVMMSSPGIPDLRTMRILLSSHRLPEAEPNSVIKTLFCQLRPRATAQGWLTQPPVLDECPAQLALRH